MYLRYRGDGKFHLENLNERIYFMKKIGLGGKTSKAKPPNNNLNKLSTNERQALHTYGRSGSYDINEFMSEGMPINYLTPYLREPLVNIIDNIKHALNKIPPYEGVVYRGTSINSKQFASLKKGQLVTSNTFLSCSKKQEVAKIFSKSEINNHIPVIYEFNIKKSGHPIDQYTGKFHEEEVLIESHKYFKIKDINARTIIFDEVESSLLNDIEKITAKSIDFKI